MSDAKDNRFYREASRGDGLMQLETSDDCDRGRHVLQPRYDVHRVGDVFEKKYVCEVCARCGHVVQRTMSIKEQFDSGLIDLDEARSAMNPVAPVLVGPFEALFPDDPAHTAVFSLDAPVSSPGAPGTITDDDLPF